jgi:hypothetical protein
MNDEFYNSFNISAIAMAFMVFYERKICLIL